MTNTKSFSHLKHFSFCFSLDLQSNFLFQDWTLRIKGIPNGMMFQKPLCISVISWALWLSLSDNLFRLYHKSSKIQNLIRHLEHHFYFHFYWYTFIASIFVNTFYRVWHLNLYSVSLALRPILTRQTFSMTYSFHPKLLS